MLTQVKATDCAMTSAPEKIETDRKWRPKTDASYKKVKRRHF